MIAMEKLVLTRQPFLIRMLYSHFLARLFSSHKQHDGILGSQAVASPEAAALHGRIQGRTPAGPSLSEGEHPLVGVEGSTAFQSGMQAEGSCSSHTQAHPQWPCISIHIFLGAAPRERHSAVS